MFKIATPLSDLFADPDAGCLILAGSDALEGRDRRHDTEKDRQALFHFELSIVNVWRPEDRAWVERIVSERRILELISFHMASCCDHPVMDGMMFKADGKIFSMEELLENAAQNIAWLKHLIRDRDIRIAVENNNYYPTSAYAHVTDAGFIAQVLVGNDISFLFDVAHAKITAVNQGISYEEYVAGLPMERVAQIHVSQWGVDAKGMAFDAHESPGDLLNEEVVALVRKYGIDYVTVEYYRDLEKLLGVLKVYRFSQRRGVA